ncbi:DUF1232 domain-containing protein [Clostridium sp.]|uniref:YkvA family protein n=1 Tax=Clostridium sp. TaxID=1506 RepID=UPI002FC7E5D1
MDISNIKVILTEKDLEGIVNEVLSNYMKISEIKIIRVAIDKLITINGTFTKKISIPFEIKISILDLQHNELTLIINKINIKKLKISNSLKNFALKKVGSKFEQFGISVVKDIIKIDFNKLCKMIPIIRFNLKELNLITYGIEAQLSNFSFNNDDKEKNTTKEETISNENTKNESTFKAKDERKYSSEDKESSGSNVFIDNSKRNYKYATLRRSLKEKLSVKYDFLHKYLVLIPDIIALFVRLYKDERVSKEIKINISVALAYLMYPLDIFPDFLPILGKIDDATIVFFILYRVLCDIPEEVILDNWEGEENIIVVCKEAVEFLSKILGIDEMKKISTIISRLLKIVYKFFLK